MTSLTNLLPPSKKAYWTTIPPPTATPTTEKSTRKIYWTQKEPTRITRMIPTMMTFYMPIYYALPLPQELVPVTRQLAVVSTTSLPIISHNYYMIPLHQLHPPSPEPGFMISPAKSSEVNLNTIPVNDFVNWINDKTRNRQITFNQMLETTKIKSKQVVTSRMMAETKIKFKKEVIKETLDEHSNIVKGITSSDHTAHAAALINQARSEFEHWIHN